MPTKLDSWKPYDVAGVIGVLGKDENGHYFVVDAFQVDSVPSARQLTLDERFGDWVGSVGSIENVRFDVFLMPKTEKINRDEVVTLLERSCGFRTEHAAAYAHAV
jgi:hypothetical protein